MKTVLCHGCFDVLHYGHLKHLQAARRYGDRLVVSLTADAFVNKGPSRPYFSAEKRAEMLKALGIVDQVTITHHQTAIPAIREVKPAYYVKGADYRDPTQDVTGEIANEKAEVERWGGKLVFTDEETHSSSRLINSFLAPWSDEQKAAIETIRSLGGFEAIKRAVDSLSGLSILVAGETILDIYRFVRPEGISSKSPSLSARFIREEQYHGGSWAIANHLRDFASVSLVAPVKTCKKIRYISETQRIFEVTEIDEDVKDRDFLIDKIYGFSGDCIVVADFGHGMFLGGELDGNLRPFVGLNVQTNSSNLGFNPYHKHAVYSYLCLDTRESRMATHDRYSDPLTIARKIASNAPGHFGFTVGSGGAYILSNGGNELHCPAFSDVVIDATGAGDAFFAITTALLCRGARSEITLFIGNVFAGLKTKIIGNKSAVSKAALLKACESILK